MNPPLLAFARAQSYEIGANQKGVDVRPMWWFLQPDLAGENDAAQATTRDESLETCIIGGVGELAKDAAAVWRLAPADTPGETSASLGRHLVALPAASGPSSRVARLLDHARRRVGMAATTTADAVTFALRPASADPRDQGILLPGGVDPGALPAYILAAGAEAGVDLSGWRWTMVPPRGYAQQKALFLGWPPGAEAPGIAVKLTQHARFNDRLANEQDALERHWPSADTDVGTLPQPLFRGMAGPCLLAAATAIDGKPFRSRCDGRPDDPLVTAAVRWLAGLGSSGHGIVAGHEVAVALTDLVDRFAAVYDVPDLVTRLRALVDVASSAPLPSVSSHGDPGTWNLLVTDRGRVAFLDWENAEAAGVPTWDQILFVQTLGSWAAQRAGRRYTPRVYARQILDDGPYRRLLRRVIDEQAREFEIDPAVTGALFHLGWVFQALKEATRLTPAQLPSARALQMLRLGMDRTGGALP